MRSISLVLLFLCGLLRGCPVPALADPPQPLNVVVCMWDDASPEIDVAMGLLTLPNYQWVRDHGVTLQGESASSVCRPALAAVMSGKLPWKGGIRNLESPGSLSPVGTLACELQADGVQTVHGAKCWEPHPSSPDPSLYCFDYSDDPGNPLGHPPMHFWRQGQAGMAQWIAARGGQRKLICPWPQLPHEPRDADAATLARIDPATIPVPAWIAPADRATFLNDTRRFWANHLRFDDQLGVLLDQLDSLGELESTLIIVANDNSLTTSLVSPAPSKQSPYQAGLAVQVAVCWLGNPAILHGVTSGALVSTTDIPATVLDYCGIARPADWFGESFRGVLEGASTIHRPWLATINYSRLPLLDHSEPYFESPLALTLRTSQGGAGSLPGSMSYIRCLNTFARNDMEVRVFWKHPFVPFLTDPVRTRGDEELYDLAADPWEAVNLADGPAHAGELAAMRVAALDWLFFGDGAGEVVNPCPLDFDYDGQIGLSDLGELLGRYGSADTKCDIDGSGTVDLSDLASLLMNFGATCP